MYYLTPADLKKPELTCISEEGIADMDLPDNILEELEYLDNITSCNKVENLDNNITLRKISKMSSSRNVRVPG